MLLQRIEYQVVAKVLFAYSSDTGKLNNFQWCISLLCLIKRDFLVL